MAADRYLLTADSSDTIYHGSEFGRRQAMKDARRLSRSGSAEVQAVYASGEHKGRWTVLVYTFGQCTWANPELSAT
jgi:hypothetical protein